MLFSHLPKLATYLATSAAIACAATPAAAKTAFDGSKIRVNMSNTLVMLTQQISAAGCSIKAATNVEAAREDLEAARYDFQLILDGLENGSPALSIPFAEKDPRVLRAINAVKKAWSDVDGSLGAVLTEGDTSATSEVITISQKALYDATSILASDILTAYSNPFEMSQSDALSLSFAGRQRMLGYQMSSSLCGIASGLTEAGTQETLKEYSTLYDRSLSALQNGLPAVGIQPPPSELVDGMLAQAQSEWVKVKPIVEAAVETGAPSEDAVDAMNSFVRDTKLLMGNTVTLYMLAGGDGGDVYKVALESYAENEVVKWLDEPILIEALRAQNAKHASLEQSDIDTLDLKWRAQMKEGGGEMIDGLLERPLSDWFRERVDATAGLVVEIFATDNLGLNVGQSGETGDYWQGDEAKYIHTIKDNQGTTHFSDMELDVENGVYQAQISAPVKDPESGEWIGVMIFSVNVQSLL
ncbi:type IV pili methyl-accepting chemotaxis transducer N-terminal domain-containing protein [Litoreibacter roseus]|uniref:NarX-like N-terminal domain-containing protein n=1 Tax=Litoreibacter roseus TaxID=2601869 RepID=A0A6N6JCD5_9RHOB|nr:type IV pili methyl-accepting chemotaxis transducer N-terminal domain-containing protein [Litoreibacter roseus]GFE63816.1 hypothetical protein KIN_08900 [Litoreibacter roseus]